MPLVKNLDVDPLIYLETFRRREFIMQADAIRRLELGKDVSIRATSMKAIALVKTLREVAEDDVTINDAILEAYADAEDWICQKLTMVFQTVIGLGYTPKTQHKSAFWLDGADPVVIRADKLVWIPAAAYVVGNERVYLFRVAYPDNKGCINSLNSGAIGMTPEYLASYAPDLAAYVARLEKNARSSPEVSAAFDRLGAMLRPVAYREEQVARRAAEYGGEDNFGGWA